MARAATTSQPSIPPRSISTTSPGEKGVPTAAQGNAGDPLDTYETDFAPSNQRNIFRQSAQKRLDICFRKSVKIKDRVTIQYAFNIFNVTNTTSLDVPQNQTQIRQTSYTCSATAMAVRGSNCANEYTYGQVVTNQADQATNNGRGTAGLALDQLPYVNGTGKSITIPIMLPVGVGSSRRRPPLVAAPTTVLTSAPSRIPSGAAAPSPWASTSPTNQALQ